MSRPSADPSIRARTGSSAIDVQGLRVSFGDRVVLDGLDLQVAAKQVVALVGRSGCGKSTLLRVIAGLNEPDYVARLACEPATIVFQEPRLLPWEPVWANVTIGVHSLDSARARTLAVDALREVGLDGHEDDWPSTLSGGEQQRVALARALVMGAGLLLLDEPFGALDALTRREMHSLLLRLLRLHEQTVLLVTHDVDEALALADHVVVLTGGRLVASHRGNRSGVATPAQLDAARRNILGDLDTAG
ncbi:ABC transporter ATP-binding protein [Gephyromycinifex aptenodytis]|uniref:ABC transporter ATP-binding protein n=1 Tax=Gephyromycinifex aptenodytis TaxID=2716227 RepID=UPI001445815C|nr:ATP-binding cassette domain-containing protein [Gephyromycinifex aptenodytis]